MSKNKLSNVQLGFFVILGTMFLIIGLYMIGNNRNIFDRTFSISATFHNVNGLMEGNGVRYSGIDVGTVKKVEIVTDTSVKVTMIIHQKVQKFIKKNSVASVGTDGLMGNKLVNINTGTSFAAPVEEGDMLASSRPVETDAMIRILNRTNLNLADITTDLKKITQKLNNSKGLWSIIGDTVVAENLRMSLRGIRTTSENAAKFTRNLNSMLTDLQQDKSIVNFLLKDTASSRELKNSISVIHAASEQAKLAMEDLRVMTGKMKHGESAAGLLLSDTTFANNLSESMKNIRTSTEKLDKNMEAMRHNFLFKGYFKDQEKQQEKEKKK